VVAGRSLEVVVENPVGGPGAHAHAIGVGGPEVDAEPHSCVDDVLVEGVTRIVGSLRPGHGRGDEAELQVPGPERARE
jgi:hypothetical protein